MLIVAGAGSVVVPVPPSTNHLFATVQGNRRVKTREYNAWLEVAIPLLRTMRAVPTEDYPVKAVLTVEEGIRGTRDLDNAIKPVLDAAKKAGRIVDDCREYVTNEQILYRPRPLGQGVRVEFVPDRE